MLADINRRSDPAEVSTIGTKPGPRGQKDEKRWRVIMAFHRRIERNESLAVRSIAEEANCTPGYVSKVLAGLPIHDRRDAAPPGSKGRDGGLEATA